MGYKIDSQKVRLCLEVLRKGPEGYVFVTYRSNR